MFLIHFSCFRRTNIKAAVVAVRIRKEKETRRRNIKKKRKRRIESIKVVHPAKTRSTGFLALGNVAGTCLKAHLEITERGFLCLG
jgi:hypothetical protein